MGWKRPETVEKESLLKRVAALEPHYRFTPENTVIDKLDLPFLQSAQLLRVLKTGKPLWYVALPNEIVALDGSVANLNYIDVHAPVLEKTKEYESFRKAFSDRNLPDDFNLPPSC